MKERHETELKKFSSTHTETVVEVAPAPSPILPKEQPKKLSKAQKKRLKQKEKEAQREKEIEEELKNAGPTARELELQRMYELYLDPLNLSIKEIPADGNCLYRAIGDCINLDYYRVRKFISDLFENILIFEN